MCLATRLTHSDPRAEDGALVIATIARALARGAEVDASIAEVIRDEDFRVRVRLAFAGKDQPLEQDQATASDGRGVSGFVVHTVPAVIRCWSRHRCAPEAAIEAAIRLGGDTDTVAAIVGALLGAELGASGLPSRWLEGIRDWPLGVAQLRALARALGEGDVLPPQPWVASLLRNLGLVVVILGHLLRRTLGR